MQHQSFLIVQTLTLVTLVGRGSSLLPLATSREIETHVWNTVSPPHLALSYQPWDKCLQNIMCSAKNTPTKWVGRQ